MTNLAPYQIGGSEAAMALGLSKLKTSHQLYLEKRGELPRTEIDPELAWWGHALEPVVRQRYAEETGHLVIAPRGEDGRGLLRSARFPFMTAHVDGIVEADPRRGYEGKTAFHSMGWGEEGTDEIPADYLLQVHHYLVVTALPVFDVAVLVGRKFATYHVEADKEMAEMLVEGERAFVGRLERGEPPGLDYQHPTTVELLKRVYKGTDGTRLEATAEDLAWRVNMKNAAEGIKQLEKVRDEAKAHLLERMGNAALLGWDDGTVMRRKQIDRGGYTVAPASYIDVRDVKDGQGVPGRKAKR